MDGITICEVGERRYRVRALLDSGFDGAQNAHSSSSNRPRRQGKTERRSITVPRQLHKYLIGSHGSTLNSIREESHAKITVPNEKSKSDLVEIEGSPEEISCAERLISGIVEENTQRVPYTHFLSLPIGDLDVQRRVKGFQDDVAKEFFKNLDDSSMINPASLHVTVGMLRLLTPAEVAKAVELLKSLHKEIYDILGTRSLVVNLAKPTAMEANPSRARIIYLQVEDFEQNSRLERVCEVVRSRFDEAGYIDEKRPLKIHATVIRATPKEPASTADDERAAGESKAIDAEKDSHDGSKRSARINAVPMMKKYGALSFGTCRIGQVQIAKRFHYTDSGAYDNDGFIALP
ncbi:hypothetical protein GQ54DRAFT_300503 [Martensiomyces pterosporus]|nr:hypothetical protein GQ54DRAFT_300503 [Martensiomyces pterosporus]